MAPFTDKWMVGLHGEIFGRAWPSAGQIRKSTPNFGVPTERVRRDLYQLSQDVHAWTHDPIEASADLHWKAVAIHPFFDGNGRWARLMANILLKQRTDEVLIWPLANGEPDAEFRDRYIKAIEAAVNEMDPEPLYEICLKLDREKPSILQARQVAAMTKEMLNLTNPIFQCARLVKDRAKPELHLTVESLGVIHKFTLVKLLPPKPSEADIQRLLSQSWTHATVLKHDNRRYTLECEDDAEGRPLLLIRARDYHNHSAAEDDS